MNSMIYVLIAFLAIIAGFILGLLFIIMLYAHKEKRMMDKAVKKDSAGNVRRGEEPEFQEYFPDEDQDDKDSSRAKQRISTMADKSSSWAQFNDDVDGTEDHANTLLKMRDGEDDSYNYLNQVIEEQEAAQKVALIANETVMHNTTLIQNMLNH